MELKQNQRNESALLKRTNYAEARQQESRKSSNLGNSIRLSFHKRNHGLGSDIPDFTKLDCSPYQRPTASFGLLSKRRLSARFRLCGFSQGFLSLYQQRANNQNLPVQWCNPIRRPSNQKLSCDRLFVHAIIRSRLPVLAVEGQIGRIFPNFSQLFRCRNVNAAG
jgi:hypothetical protein